nr:T9SS type A sorting domain-containing protein [bacterium]
GLPELPLYVVVVDPDYPQQLFVGSDVGVYYASAPAYAWQALGTGLPKVPVLDLKFHQPTRNLVAGTHGRSMFRLDLSQMTSVNDSPEQPSAALLGNFPNPFNPSTEIRFRLAEPGPVSLGIFDVSGRLVRQLRRAERLPAGDQSANWDGRTDRGDSAPSGVYFVRLEAENDSHSLKIQLLK